MSADEAEIIKSPLAVGKYDEGEGGRLQEKRQRSFKLLGAFYLPPPGNLSFYRVYDVWFGYIYYALNQLKSPPLFYPIACVAGHAGLDREVASDGRLVHEDVVEKKSQLHLLKLDLFSSIFRDWDDSNWIWQ